MFTITFLSPEKKTQIRAQGVWGTKRKALNYAKKLAESFKEVVVWQGQPGGMRIETLNPLPNPSKG